MQDARILVDIIKSVMHFKFAYFYMYYTLL